MSYKKLGILFLVFIAAIFFWSSSEQWIRNPVWSLVDVQPWVVPVLTLIVLAASLGIAFMLLDTIWLKIGASALSALPFLALFGFQPLYLVAALVLVILHLNAIQSVADETKNRIKVNARLIVRRGMSMIILPHLLLISFAYYQTPAVKDAGKDLKLPKSIQQAITSTTELFVGPQLEQLSAEQRAQVQNQVTTQLMIQLTNIAKPYLGYLPPLLAFGLFLALQGLSPIFFWLASYLALGLFTLLKSIKFFVIEEKDVKAETIKV